MLIPYYKIKMEEQEIKENIRNWMEENRHRLPLNMDSWQVQVFKKGERAETPQPLRLGKYNAALANSNPLYKPYSKTHIFPWND